MRGPGLGTTRALPGARALRGMSSRLLAHAGRQPLRFQPRACTRKMRWHFSRQTPRSDSLQQRAPPRTWPLTASARQACRYALCGLSVNPASFIVPTTQRQAARGPVFARWSTPRHGASECRIELRPTRHRATSHNGARYAFVRSKTPSHVALSGAPPRCLLPTLKGIPIKISNSCLVGFHWVLVEHVEEGTDPV